MGPDSLLGTEHRAWTLRSQKGSRTASADVLSVQEEAGARAEMMGRGDGACLPHWQCSSVLKEPTEDSPWWTESSVSCVSEKQSRQAVGGDRDG